MRPRLSEAYGPSLTPPSRVEKATSYGPGGRPADHARQLPLGLGEQPLAFVQARVADHAGEQVLERRAERRAGLPAELDQVVAVDGELVEPVRAVELAHERLVERGRAGRAPRGRVVRGSPACPEIGPLVRDEIERELVAVAVQEPSRLAAASLGAVTPNMCSRTIARTRCRSLAG